MFSTTALTHSLFTFEEIASHFPRPPNIFSNITTTPYPSWRWFHYFYSWVDQDQESRPLSPFVDRPLLENPNVIRHPRFRGDDFPEPLSRLDLSSLHVRRAKGNILGCYNYLTRYNWTSFRLLLPRKRESQLENEETMPTSLSVRQNVISDQIFYARNLLHEQVPGI